MNDALTSGGGDAGTLLRRSRRLQDDAAAMGFDWPEVSGVWAKLDEELGELRRAGTDAERCDELGDVLFVIVNLARHLGVDPEMALAGANAKFVERWRAMEPGFPGLPPLGSPERLDAMEALWQQAKRSIRRDGTGV